MPITVFWRLTISLWKRIFFINKYQDFIQKKIEKKKDEWLIFIWTEKENKQTTMPQAD